MDITIFMSWFVNQVVSIFTSVFNILDNITFAGTSVLGVLVTLTILGSLLGVLITISAPNLNFGGSKSEKVKTNKNLEKQGFVKHDDGYWFD